MNQELIGALLACSFFCLFPNSSRGANHLQVINFDHLFAYVSLIIFSQILLTLYVSDLCIPISLSEYIVADTYFTCSDVGSMYFIFSMSVDAFLYMVHHFVLHI